jgi:hypothetical protein
VRIVIKSEKLEKGKRRDSRLDRQRRKPAMWVKFQPQI